LRYGRFQESTGTRRPSAQLRRIAPLAYLAHFREKISHFQVSRLRIPWFFVVENAKSACSEDPAS
jgi:hypothetical protein